MQATISLGLLRPRQTLRRNGWCSMCSSTSFWNCATAAKEQLMRAHKRALKITWREAWPVWLTFGILFAFGVFGVWLLMPAAETPTKALAQGEDVTAGVAELQPNQPKLFAYPIESGPTTEFFVVRDAGHFTVAFASCRKCYRAGHYRQGSEILCRKCNDPMPRAISGQTPTAENDCTQIPIPFENSGDRLTIRASAVRDTFTRWYGPVISGEENRTNESQK